MSSLLLGTLAGVLFGIIAVLLMIPLKFDDKRAAMVGAFVNRFSIGFVIGAAPHLFSLAAWISGLLFGLLLSLADAIITKSYIPLHTSTEVSIQMWAMRMAPRACLPRHFLSSKK